MNNTQRLASIDTLLAGVPQFQCVEGCADCCGPVTMTALEWKRLAVRTGDTKLKEKTTAAAKDIMDGGHGSCPMLDKSTNKCSVYDIRPAICRVFGARGGDAPLVNGLPARTKAGQAYDIPRNRYTHGQNQPAGRTNHHFVSS
jgi:Fe-S-cluster containining protein